MKITIGNLSIDFNEKAVRSYKSKEAFLKDQDFTRFSIPKETIDDKLGEVYDLLVPKKVEK